MVDRQSTAHLYVQLADDIAVAIRQGTLQPGQQVPSEAELAQAHQMSRGAVRAAVRLLRERELVYTIQARGTFVIDRSPPPTQGA
jgi:DNA-binding GntR family transcriptional regulator